jgi:shikimate kinase
MDKPAADRKAGVVQSPSFDAEWLDACFTFVDTVMKFCQKSVMTELQTPVAETLRDKALKAIGGRNLILVGLMGAGKSAIGRMVAAELGIPFIDTDHEIETVSRMTIAELFAAYGEDEFRALETRVVGRILQDGPRVVSTGGGAFINERTREEIRNGGLSVWLKADLETLWERVNKRSHRPLLKTENPKQTLEKLMDSRYPIYAQADITMVSRNVRKDVMTREVLKAVARLNKENCTDE